MICFFFIFCFGGLKKKKKKKRSQLSSLAGTWKSKAYAETEEGRGLAFYVARSEQQQIV